MRASTFNIPPDVLAEKADQVRREGRIGALAGLAAGLALAVLLLALEVFSPPVLLLTALLYLPFSWLVGGYYARTQIERWNTYRVTLEGETITLQEGGRIPKTIRRDQVTEIHHFPGVGLLIKTDRPNRQIFVVEEIGGFETIRAQVKGWGESETGK